MTGAAAGERRREVVKGRCSWGGGLAGGEHLRDRSRETTKLNANRASRSRGRWQVVPHDTFRSDGLDRKERGAGQRGQNRSWLLRAAFQSLGCCLRPRAPGRLSSRTPPAPGHQQLALDRTGLGAPLHSPQHSVRALPLQPRKSLRSARRMIVTAAHRPFKQFSGRSHLG